MIDLTRELRARLHSYFESLDSTVIACSGGVDSMFLTRVAAEVAKSANINLHAIIVDHNLQLNSSTVAQRTQEILQTWGVNSTIMVWNHKMPFTGIEEKARNARYQLIIDYCKLNQIKHVLLAHHIDDKIETFFLHAMRGTGLVGLSSMRERTIKSGIEFFRPMVFLLDKPQIVQYMQTSCLPWFEDETNKDTKFTRNNIRKMLNLSYQQKRGILQTIQNIENECNRKDEYIKVFFTNNVQQDAFGVKLAIDVLAAEDFSIFREIIKKLLLLIFPYSNSELRQSVITNLHNWLLNANCKTTLMHCMFVKSGNMLRIVPEYKKLSFLSVKKDFPIIWNNIIKFQCNMDCIIVPLGNVAFSIKKKFNIKKPLLEIAHLPVFMQEDNILAIPHLEIFNDKNFEILFYENYSS
jgi:tRNA(Ile)-lysidine synthase